MTRPFDRELWMTGPLDVKASLGVGPELRPWPHTRAGHVLHAPAHVDAEVLSALGRLHRARDLDDDEVEAKLGSLVVAPITRHPVNDLMLGAWADVTGCAWRTCSTSSWRTRADGSW